MAGDIDRGGAQLPAEGDGFGVLVDGVIRLFGRSGGCAVDQMQLIAVLIAVNIVADDRAVDHAEDLAVLLADGRTLHQFNAAVALGEFIGISVSLNCSAELLRAHQTEVLHVVGIDVVDVRTGGAFGDGGQTVPHDALGINAAGLNGIKNAVVNARFIQMLAGLVPNKFTHNLDPP